MHWDLMLTRRSRNRLHEPTVRKHLHEMVQAAQKVKSMGFTGRVAKLEPPDEVFDEATGETCYHYSLRIRLTKEASHADVAALHFRHVYALVEKIAQSKGYSLVVNGQQAHEPAPPRGRWVVPELSDDVFTTFFRGVYERDRHVRVIHDAVRSHARSLALHEANPDVPVQRSHVLLKGRPASCKSTLFERFKRWYGDEHVLFLDGHGTSKAGLENWLLERAECGRLPDILVIEEIEKQPLDNMLSLLSVMGSGYVSKLNARIGHAHQVANLMVWATCNDEEAIRNFRGGALWSRFAHRLHCPRPSRDLMEHILVERAISIGGNVEWAYRAMEFAYETVPDHFDQEMDDPREIVALLDGGDRLLDGSYQDDKLDIMRGEVAETNLVST